MMAQNYKAVIVDDEQLARYDLKKALSNFQEIEIIGEADNVKSASKIINSQKPDLIFLDIQLTGETGFDLLDLIEYETNIVFVTAYDKYAIRAFDVNAVDYLLKPVDIERLGQTLEKISSKTNVEESQIRRLQYDDVMFLQLGEKVKFQRISEIVVIASNADYTSVITVDGKKRICKKTMKEWEARLPENYFARIHRETIVNFNHIKNIDAWFNGSYKVYMQNIENPFVMSRRYAAKLKDHLG